MVFLGMRRHDPGQCVEGVGVWVWEAGLSVVQWIWKLMDAVDSFIPEPVRRDRQAVFDAGGGCVYDQWARDGGDGTSGARRGEVGDEVEMWDTSDAEAVCTGVESFGRS